VQIDVGLDDVLETVQEFGAASLELVAWEFCLAADALEGVWRQAVQRGLISPVGRCPSTGELMFAPAPAS
jgi:hypothetical protein